MQRLSPVLQITQRQQRIESGLRSRAKTLAVLYVDHVIALHQVGKEIIEARCLSRLHPASAMQEHKRGAGLCGGLKVLRLTDPLPLHVNVKALLGSRSVMQIAKRQEAVLKRYGFSATVPDTGAHLSLRLQA